MGIMDKVKQASSNAFRQAQDMVNDGVGELKNSNPIPADQPIPPRSQPATSATGSTKFCSQCGTGIEGMRFCPQCGSSIVNAAPIDSQTRLQPNNDLQPIYTFISHIQGKNAKVKIYPQYIEWEREGSKIAHAAKATATFGVSLLSGKKHSSEMVPIKSISHVATAKDGLVNSKVILSTSGGDIEMRVSHSEAAKIKTVITDLLLNQ